MDNLPEGWFKTSLSKIANITMGQSPAGEFTNFSGAGLPLVGGAADFNEGKIEVTRYTSKPTKISEIGDLILCIRATIGKVAFADEVYCLGRGVAGIKSLVNPKWLYYKLLDSAKELDAAGTGSTFRQVDKKTLEEWPIVLPPFDEQELIVSRLDNLLSKSKNAHNLLSVIPSLADRYRRSVLDKAYMGDEQLSERWPKKTLGEILTNTKSGKSLRCEERPPLDNERGVLKVSAVTWGTFNPRASKTLPPDYEPDEATKVKDGDFLISRANTLELVGAVVIVENSPDNLYLSDKIIRLEMEEEVKPWVLWYLRSTIGRNLLQDKASGTQLSMRNISQEALKSIPIPWPDENLRKSIVDQIETSFQSIDRLSLETKRAYNLLDRLNESILSRAFAGKLVPQTKDLESAETFVSKINSKKIEIKRQQKKRTLKKNESIILKKTILEVLLENDGWLTSQEAFRLCGIGLNATTEDIEPIYSELRYLDQNGYLDVLPIRDENDKKLYDQIKLNRLAYDASK